MVTLRPQSRCGWSGFTLIELMVTLILLGILGMMAAPSFTEMLAAHRIRSAASDLQAALVLTRSEALKRNGNVELVAADGWNGAWNLQWAADHSVIGGYDPVSGASIVEAGSLTAVTYRPNGRLAGSDTPRFTISASGAMAGAIKCLRVGLSGMPYFTTASGSGVCP